MAFTVNGSPSRTSFLHTEAHKTTQEFTAAAVIKRGQALKLDANAAVIIWTSADLRYKFIGVAYNDAAIGELVTVWTRGYAIIWALSNAAIDPSVPVTVSSYDAATVGANGAIGFPKYANSATADQTIGWSLDVADSANDPVRILLMD